MTASAPDEFDALKIISDTLKPFKIDDQSRMLRWIAEKLGLTVSIPNVPTAGGPPAVVTVNPPRPQGSATT